MLDTMRRHSKSGILYLIFGVIILVFVFSFGAGSSGFRIGDLSTDSLRAAEVNGQSIPTDRFEREYSAKVREFQERFGGEFNEEWAQGMKLREMVLDQIIDRELLAQAAIARGIVVSDREVADEIAQAFRVDGAFDEQAYTRYVENQIGTTRPKYEDEIRRLLLARKIVGSLSAAVLVSDDEVRADYARQKEKLNLAYARFAPRAFQDQVAAPTEEQLAAYLKDNAAKVEEHYKNNASRYNKPKRVHARHILVSLAEDAPQADVDAATKKLKELKEKIAGGADFAELAKQTSDDKDTKEKGGDLGLFGPGTMDPALQDAAFKLAKGEVSEPVRSRQGMSLVKVEEILPEENRALADVQKEIAAEHLREQGAKELAKKKAEETLADLRNGKALEELWPAADPKDGEPLMPSAKATEPFSPVADYVPGIGRQPEIMRTALALTMEKPVADKVFEVDGTYLAVVLKGRERADLKELESKLAEVREQYRSKRAEAAVDGFIKTLRAGAKIERNAALVGSSAPLDLSSLENG